MFTFIGMKIFSQNILWVKNSKNLLFMLPHLWSCMKKKTCRGLTDIDVKKVPQSSKVSMVMLLRANDNKGISHAHIFSIWNSQKYTIILPQILLQNKHFYLLTKIMSYDQISYGENWVKQQQQKKPHWLRTPLSNSLFHMASVWYPAPGQLLSPWHTADCCHDGCGLCPTQDVPSEV